MDRQIVHDDDVAGVQIGNELLLDESKKDIGAGAGVDGHQASKSVEREGANHRNCLPCAVDALARGINAARSPSETRRRTQTET